MASNRSNEGFAHSMSDMMAGVAVVFLLIAVIFMARVAAMAAQHRAAAERFQSQLRALESDDRRAISELERLRDELTNDPTLRRVLEPSYDRESDPFLLTLVFDRQSLRFGAAQCTIDDDVRSMINASFAPIFRAVCRAANTGYIQSITMEGHTDNRPFLPGSPVCGVDRAPQACLSNALDPACVDLGFANNVRLSGARAQNVLFEVQRLFTNDAALRECVEGRFVVAGRGPVEPLDGREWRANRGEADNDANRRVVIKVRATSRLRAQ